MHQPPESVYGPQPSLSCQQKLVELNSEEELNFRARSTAVTVKKTMTVTVEMDYQTT